MNISFNLLNFVFKETPETMIGHAPTTTELVYEELQLYKHVFWMTGTSPTNKAVVIPAVPRAPLVNY